MQSSHLNNDKFIIAIIALGLFFLSYFQFKFGVAYRLYGEAFGNTQIYFFILVFCLFTFFSYYHKQTNTNVFLWILCGYLMFVFLASKPLGLTIIVSALFFIFWIFCFSFGNRLSNATKETSLFFINTISIIAVLPLLLLGIYTFFTTTELLTNQLATDAFISIIVYLPFVLMIQEKKALKILLYVLMIVVSILSMKRSIMIGVFVCSIIYFLLTDHKKVLSKWYFWLSILVVVLLSKYLYNIVAETIAKRFMQLENDGGSGRDLIYNTIWLSFQLSDITSIIFGHGYESTKLIVGKLAHNDFLQLLYDCGLVGVGLYILFLLSLIVLAIRKYRRRKTNTSLYAAFVSSILFYIILASLNCFIYSPMLISPIMLALGLSGGLLRSHEHCT